MKFKHWYKIKGRTIILKKIIPTAISISLLTNMIFVSSSNSTWSDDGRYEIFKDTDITVHDIIEDDNTNVKLKGDTLVNLVNNLDDWVGHGTGIFTKDSNSLTISNTTAYSKFYKTFTLKPNTTYTYFVECENNSNTIAQSYFRHGSSAISSGAQFLGQTKPNSISIHRNYFVTNNDG
ncbi:MAG: hypothetical protein IJ086_00285, partial [Clostridium sp.]|nr:hypothetical protein [Clostridium sp.]